jgi:hypothetical protein
MTLTRELRTCVCGRSAARDDLDGRAFVLGPARLLVEDAGRWFEAEEHVDIRRPTAPLL